jgi:signal peptidase I
VPGSGVSASGFPGNGVSASGYPGNGVPVNGGPYGAGDEGPYPPGASVPPPAQEPLPAQEPPYAEDAAGRGRHGAHRADPAGPGGPGDVDAGDDEPSGEGARGSKQRSFWKELPLLVGIALVLALLIKTFLVQAFSIPSDSMQHTLERGDRVLVDKLTPWFGSKPTRGEVVVFQDPGGWLPENPPASSNPVVRGLQKSLSFIGLMPSADEKDLIKRVIGVGGDTVECEGTGPVKVNGKPLNEPYVFAGNTPCSPDNPFKITVPKGRIWVMGDHRQDSLDSRFHMSLPGGGTVSDSDVVGRAVTIAWPVNRWTWLGIPSTFSQPGINAAGTAGPAAVGLAGALPLVLLRRKRLLRKAGEGAGADAVSGAGSGPGSGAESGAGSGAEG